MTDPEGGERERGGRGSRVCGRGESRGKSERVLEVMRYELLKEMQEGEREYFRRGGKQERWREREN